MQTPKQKVFLRENYLNGLQISENNTSSLKKKKNDLTVFYHSPVSNFTLAEAQIYLTPD